MKYFFFFLFVQPQHIIETICKIVSLSWFAVRKRYKFLGRSKLFESFFFWLFFEFILIIEPTVPGWTRCRVKMNAFSTHSNDSFEEAEKLKRKERFKVTRRLSAGAIVALVAWIFLLIAFASPYWLSSYKYTYSEFVRLGLWDFCFRDYRHPSYQYDQKFSGCYWVYSGVYHNIRDWLQPGKLRRTAYAKTNFNYFFH